MSDERQERCETCRFGEKVCDDTASQIRCRRYPPTLGIDESETAAFAAVQQLGFRFPWMDADDWCGEWQGESFSALKPELAAMSVLDLDVPYRAKNALDRSGIKTVGELVSYNRKSLLGIRNFGETSLRDLREGLSKLGLKLKGD